ncbi:MAG: hypothetical protein JW838_04940 [Spirochaetes bacterium]|nr:hypothetical protein [Spirochaetota bacterium]
MGRFKCSNRILLFPIMIGLPLVACDRHSYHYTGDALSLPRPWLKNKKILLDAGYDAPSRHTSPASSFNEIDTVIRVSGILTEMLRGAGASVETCPRSSSVLESAEMALHFSPDLVIGIRTPAHHDGVDDPSRPLILLGGPRDLHPASFDLAVLLMDEFHKIMEGEGIIAPETASRGDRGGILRYTASVCPGVTGIPASYPGIDNSRLAGQAPYLEKLAEAYFFAISTYFKRGIPTAKLSFSCPVETAEPGIYLIREESPSILIHTDAGGEAPGIDDRSLRISLDGLPLEHEKISENRYMVAYGKRIHPGRHRLRFHLKNIRGQSSMRYTADFDLASHPGDRERLITEGTALLGKQGQQREGLAMLLSALSHGIAHDDIEGLLQSVIRGFTALGITPWAAYYRDRLSTLQRVSRDVHSRKPFTLPEAVPGPLYFDGKSAPVLSGHCAAEKERRVPSAQRAKKWILGLILDCMPNFNFHLEGK